MKPGDLVRVRFRTTVWSTASATRSSRGSVGSGHLGMVVATADLAPWVFQGWVLCLFNNDRLGWIAPDHVDVHYTG
jgi:hypothetical protein